MGIVSSKEARLHVGTAEKQSVYLLLFVAYWSQMANGTIAIESFTARKIDWNNNNKQTNELNYWKIKIFVEQNEEPWQEQYEEHQS